MQHEFEDEGCAERRTPAALMWTALVIGLFTASGPARAADETNLPPPVLRTGVPEPAPRLIPSDSRHPAGTAGHYGTNADAGTVPLPDLDPITLTPTGGLNLSTGSGSVSVPISRAASRPSSDEFTPLPHSGLDVTSPLGLILMGASVVVLAGVGWYSLRRQ